MTDLLQRQASSPDQSVFVSANAGTGKTKVLIERVLRLLLSGEVPETILCVTFTRAAAAEIEARLHRKLAEWAIAQPSELVADIQAITGALPTQSTIEVARRLFAQVIDNDQGPRIETTHSFCQSLLSRFPLEAGLPPHFELISEAQKEGLLRAGFASAFSEPAQQMKEALSHLVGISDHQSLFDHVKSFVGKRKLSDAAIAMPLGVVPAFDKAMTALLPDGLADEAQIVAYYTASLKSLPYHELADARPEKMAPFISWLALPEAEQHQGLHNLTPVFLTKKGTPHSRFLNKAALDENPSLADIFARFADVMISFNKAQTALATVCRTRALYVVGRHVAQYYEVAKLRGAVLDYDDLIIKADKLLSSSEAMAWVRWKLDFGIHHMLVDEAQDTNPAQWELLASLADEFFAHEADEDNPRTLFSVGDFKQSIYSFQGANPHIFIEKGAEFDTQAKSGNHRFSDVKLTMSFRSSKAVLDMVNYVMTLDEVEGLGGAYHAHEAFFADKFGMVELWPIVKASEKPPELPYLDVPDFVAEGEGDGYGADALLAEQIAAHIATMLDGTAEGVNGKCYQPRDIMILVNKRNTIFALIRGALLRHNIPVAGPDRMRLDRQIEIQDLLALGDVCVLQEDDLQLAAFLKSPLIGLEEEALMSLAMGRPKGQSVIAALKGYAGRDDEFGAAIAKLEHYFDLAIGLSPAAFYETILAQGGREAFYQRLGVGVGDSLNAFIDQAYEFEKEGGTSLADFLAHHRAHETEIKRDFGNIQENQVRIMTIHGSKGLESPVVYVPDIVKGIEPATTLIASDDVLYWPADSQFMPDDIAAHKEQAKQARTAEHQRLLYVAMTRASECLFLAGFEKSRQSLSGISWDVLLEKGFQAAAIQADEAGIYRYHHHGKTDEAGGQSAAVPDKISGDITTRLSWAFTPPPEEVRPLRPLIPSAADESEVPESLSYEQGKKSQQHAHPRLEGIFMHDLLDSLSTLAPDARLELALRKAEASLLAHSPREAPIGTDRLIELAHKMVRFMAEPEFAPLFGPAALSEFGISGIVGTRPVVGQIDKLLVTEESLWLVDFKSGRPQRDNVPHSYILQMALYAALLREIYPDKKMQAEIIWLRDMSRSPLPENALQQALTSAGIL